MTDTQKIADAASKITGLECKVSVVQGRAAFEIGATWEMDDEANAEKAARYIWSHIPNAIVAGSFG